MVFIFSQYDDEISTTLLFKGISTTHFIWISANYSTKLPQCQF